MSSLLRQELGTATPSASGSNSRVPSGSLLLWGIVIAAAILRVIALGRKSFWLDEIASVAISRRPLPLFAHFLWHDEGNMALYYALLKPWLHFGYSETAVRFLSVIPGVLSIPLMYVLGAHLFGKKVGTLGAALLALNTCAISVSQEARAYSFVVLFVLLSTFLFVRLIETPSYSAAMAYALVAGLTCYFQYFGVLVPAAHAVSLVSIAAHSRRWKPLCLAWGLIALLASPILWLIHVQDVGHISWLQPPSWLELYHLGVFLAADGGKAVGGVLLALELVLAGLFVGAMRKVWRATGDDLPGWRYALVASLVITPVVLSLLVSIVRPAFYHRFLIICLPGWLLMVAVGATQMRQRAWRIATIVSVGTLSLASTGLLYRQVTEDWRGAVNYLIAHTSPGDRVLYYQSVGEFAGESYRDWLQPGAPRPQASGINPANLAWERDIDHADRTWLVLYRVKPDDAEARSIERDLTEHYALESEKSFPGLTIFEYHVKRILIR